MNRLESIPVYLDGELLCYTKSIQQETFDNTEYVMSVSIISDKEYEARKKEHNNKRRVMFKDWFEKIK